MQGFILLEVRGSEDALPLVDGANVFGFAFCLPTGVQAAGELPAKEGVCLRPLFLSLKWPT